VFEREKELCKGCISVCVCVCVCVCVFWEGGNEDWLVVG
jgi:hypothetical protein